MRWKCNITLPVNGAHFPETSEVTRRSWEYLPGLDSDQVVILAPNRPCRGLAWPG